MFEPTGADNQNVSSNVNPAPSTEGVTPNVDPAVTPAPSQNPAERGSLRDWFANRLAGNQEPNNNPVPPTPTATNPASVIPGQQEPPKTEPVTEPPALDIPDKFKNVDGSLNAEALIKSYTNMESMYGKQQATLQQMNDLQQTVIGLQQQIVAANQAKAEPADQLTPEQLEAKLEADKEAFWEAWNENPKKAMQNLINEAIQPVVTPIQQEREFQQQVNAWGDQVSKAASEHEDFHEILPDMQELAKVYGDVLSTREDAVEVLYNLAKANRASSPEPPATPEPVAKVPTMEELLNDKELIAQLTQNPAVKNLIIQQHMAEIKNNSAPPVIGTKPGGQPPSSEPVNLKDPKEAKRALMAKYSGISLT